MPRAGARGGFTLLEILLTIAIIALIATVLIGGSTRLLSDQPATPAEVFWKAVQEGRKAALKAEHDMRLRFDREKKQFVIVDGLAPARTAPDGTIQEEVPVKVFTVPAAVAADLTVEFLAAGKGGPSILVGGVLLESQTVPYVTFYSDGTCTAFRAQFFRNGSAHILAVDPWTCAPMLVPSDQNGATP